MSEPFVQIPRSLFDAITREKLPGSETRIVLYLIGQSIGWQRSETATFGSISAISAGAGCGRRTTIQGLASLCSRGLVVCVHRGGPGRGPSSYRLAPASEWARTSEQVRTTETHPGSEQTRPSEQTRTSEQECTTGSEQVRTTGSEQECTLYKKKKRRVKEDLPPNPPRGSGWMDDLRSIEDEESFGDFSPDAWTPARLVVHLGGRVPIPPLQQPRWAAIILNSTEEQIAEALKLAETADRPARYFLALFDDQGKRKADPEWKGKRRPAASRTPEEKKAYFAEITRKAEEKLATMAPLTRR